MYTAIVERGSPGLEIIDDWSSFGQRTTASGTVVLDDVFVPASHVIASYLSWDKPSANGPVAQIMQAAIDHGIAAGTIAETIRFVRTQTRPWIDSGQEHGYEDVYTIAAIGDLEVKLHASELILERAGRLVDDAVADPTEERWRQRRWPWQSRRSSRPSSRSFRPTSCSSWRQLAPRWPSTHSTGTGETPAPTRCTTRCAGSTTSLATTT